MLKNKNITVQSNRIFMDQECENHKRIVWRQDRLNWPKNSNVSTCYRSETWTGIRLLLRTLLKFNKQHVYQDLTIFQQFSQCTTSTLAINLYLLAKRLLDVTEIHKNDWKNMTTIIKSNGKKNYSDLFPSFPKKPKTIAGNDDLFLECTMYLV